MSVRNKEEIDYQKVCRSLNNHMNLLRQIQTELFDVSPSAAGTGYGSCQQLHD